MLDSAAAANTIAIAAGKMEGECSNANGSIATMPAALSSNRASGVAADRNQPFGVSTERCGVGAEAAKQSAFGHAEGYCSLGLQGQAKLSRPRLLPAN